MDTIDTIPGASLGAIPVNRQQAGYVRKITVVIRSAISWLEQRLERRRSRHALLELSDDQLKDIGISRADAYREGLRSFWD